MSFLERFSDRISVLGRDGAIHQVAPIRNDPPAPPPATLWRKPSVHDLTQIDETRSRSADAVSRPTYKPPSSSYTRTSSPTRLPPMPVRQASPPKRHSSPMRVAPVQVTPYTFTNEVKAPPATSAEMLAFSKKPRDVDFTPYRSAVPKMNQKLGGLGADLQNEDLLAKKAQKERMLEFASKIRYTHTQQPLPKRKESPPKPKPTSKRDKGIEFAAQVPKPKLQPVASAAPSRSDDSFSSGGGGGGFAPTAATRVPMRGTALPATPDHLQQLLMKHDRSVALVQQIRAGMY